MRKRPHFLITGKMIRDLCAGSPRERLLHRVHCVALVLYGLSASEVARIFKDSPRAVSYWVEQFKREGLKGLGEDARPGRPSKLDDQQKEEIAAFIEEARARSKPASAETLARHILNVYKVSLTTRQCSRILRRFSRKTQQLVLSGSTSK